MQFKIKETKCADKSCRAFRIPITDREGNDEADASYPPVQIRAEFLMTKEPVADTKGGKSYWACLYAFTLHGTVKYANTKNLFVEPIGNGFEDTKNHVAKLALDFLYSGIKSDLRKMKEAEAILEDIIRDE